MGNNLQGNNNFDDHLLGELIVEMRKAYKRGENAMEYARTFLKSHNQNSSRNTIFSTMISYDLQAGTYVKGLKNNSQFKETKFGPQLAGLIEPYLSKDGSVLEVGVGEATTLFYVIKSLNIKPLKVCGFDISWSRIKVAKEYLSKNGQDAELFVGDMFNIPIAENSVDVVYSSHSLEPNGGYEELLMKECFRVAKKAVVFVEPIFEFATLEGQKRMLNHGYIKGLYNIAKKMEWNIEDYRLLEYTETPLNPTGVLTISKPKPQKKLKSNQKIHWQCPISKTPLIKLDDGFYSRDAGLAYPIVQKIPLLTKQNSIVANRFEQKNNI